MNFFLNIEAIDFEALMQFIIPIAIKPYLKKYLAKDFDINPFEISRANPYGLYLLNSLKPADSKQDMELDQKVHSETLTTVLGEKYWIERGHVISKSQQYYFNKSVDYFFREEMYKYIWMRIGPKGSLNQAIVTFCEHYGITEDDLALKTIQKWQERRTRRASA